ncbi:MAG: TldD/PmbA family protein [Bacillota bacterium]|nr:TldD/PmbA family protein [Bacillota bacterium]
MADLFESLPTGVQAELRVSKVHTAGVRFANSEFEGTRETLHEVSALRVVKDGRMSLAASTKPGSDRELLDAALEAAKYGTPVPEGFSFPGPAGIPQISLVSEETRAAGLAQMIAVGEDLTSAMLAHDRRLRVMAAAERDEIEVSLRNTAGFSGSYAKTVWSSGVGCQLVQGEDFLFFGESRTRVDPHEDYDGLKREVIQVFDWARETAPFAAGAYPVIFAPSEVSYLMAPFLACLNGKAFARGVSPLRERMGQQLLDPRITLVDDGTLADVPASAPFDREGVPTRRNVLVEAGVPRTLLLDLQTAAELKLEPTGNGRGSGPGPNHVLLQPGDTALDDMIRGIELGLIIYGSMGAWAGNPYGGNVSGTISLGLRIEKGRIAGRVKNCMFSVNAFEHFRDRVLALSRETKQLGGGGVGGGAATYPYVLLDGVVVSTNA